MKESSLKAKTAKGLFWGGVGNGLQQLFNLFFGIFLARLLDASDYGMIGMLAIFSAISSVIQEGGFGAALINKEKITQEDCNAVFWFSLSAGFCLYILLFLSAPFIAGFYGIPELAPLSRFMFLGFLIGCTGTVHGAIFTKRLMIKEKIHINLIALFCSGCIGLAMAYCGMAYWAIATQQVSYMLLMVSMLWYKSPWKPTLQFSAAPPERNAAIQHQNCLYQHLQPNQPEHTDRIDGKILYFPASGLLHPGKQMDDDGKFACDKHGDQRCPARTDTGIVRSGEAKECFQENAALCLIHILPRHAGTGIDSS